MPFLSIFNLFDKISNKSPFQMIKEWAFIRFDNPMTGWTHSLGAA